MEVETAPNSLDPVTTPEQDVAWFRTFVAAWPWRFAKTYVESYPHEYTLERQGSAADFARAIHCIERWGVVEPFWGEQRKYLYVDDRKYWHMGHVSSEKPEHQPTLINRTWLDVARYREQARTLGYDEPSAEKLAPRWRMLLEKAKGGTL
jgi:hypothetical protein